MQYDLEKELLKILPFYNNFIDVPKIKKSSSVHLLKELPFYNDLKIVRANNTFRWLCKNL